MSAEGLIGEVSAILGSRLTIKAADQAFFGGKQVYTDVSNASTSGTCSQGGNNVQNAIANAKQIVENALGGAGPSGGNADNSKVFAEIAALKKENASIKDELAQLRKLIQDLSLGKKEEAAPTKAATPAPAPAAAEEEDEDVDLFGSDDSDDEEKKKIVEERLKAYHEKKSKKTGPIAKSSVILDIKPWDDETDLAEMEKLVRSIEMDGLVWGGGKLIPIGYGIQKFQIISVIEDAKVSVDDLIEKITGDFEDHVQSVDIVAFNKI